MKILHIFKTEPDGVTNTLVEVISKGEEATAFELYKDNVDYGKLLDLVFEHDKVISWW